MVSELRTDRAKRPLGCDGGARYRAGVSTGKKGKSPACPHPPRPASLGQNQGGTAKLTALALAAPIVRSGAGAFLLPPFPTGRSCVAKDKQRKGGSPMKLETKCLHAG